MTRSRHIAALLLILFFVLPAGADEARALERLMGIVEALEQIGDETVGDPVTGTVAVGDTASLELTLDSRFMYHVHIWSDSYFNLMEFWLTDSMGDVHSIADGDNAILAAYPDTTSIWKLNILLHEGAYSDSASFATAIFRGSRYI